MGRAISYLEERRLAREEVAELELTPCRLFREIRRGGQHYNSTVQREFERHPSLSLSGVRTFFAGRRLDSYVHPASAGGVNNMRAVAPF